MRYSLRLSVALIITVASAAGLLGQRGDADQVALAIEDRIELVNSVLAARRMLFGQPVIIDGCALSQALGVPNEDMTGRLTAEFRARVRGAPTTNCNAAFGERPEAHVVRLAFTWIRHETSEYVPGVDAHLGPRPSGLVVIRVRVTDPGGGGRIEEFVMAVARPAVWRVVTVRVFMIGANGQGRR